MKTIRELEAERNRLDEEIKHRQFIETLVEFFIDDMEITIKPPMAFESDGMYEINLYLALGNKDMKKLAEVI
ncbi:MAG: hypothetical protein ACRCX7_11205 [Cetobacterium sp.]|uniref:hypothetical protein n=1 Tax=Cetobacterium sp. TaxID=2071632 RepID=UPI003F412F9C